MAGNVSIDELAQSVLKKPLQECSEAELRQLVKDYPYFGPAQLLLAKKLEEAGSDLQKEQVQTTSLYFPNRLWLQYLLSGDSSGAVIDRQRTEIKETSKYAEQETVYAAIPVNGHEATLLPEQQPATEEGKESTDPALKTEEVNDLSIEEPPVNKIKEEPAIVETTNETSVEPATISIEMSSLKIEPVTGAGLTFEPYHTVDYFASQGIKFREDEKPKDRFSQQLKSFTEWLKTMKKIPATEANITTDTVAEKKIEQLAEHSLVERHVVTEAMAEVWIKQGNRGKAEEIYRKLSLLDPSKSSYFAAKIEEIKKTS